MSFFVQMYGNLRNNKKNLQSKIKSNINCITSTTPTFSKTTLPKTTMKFLIAATILLSGYASASPELSVSCVHYAGDLNLIE